MSLSELFDLTEVASIELGHFTSYNYCFTTLVSISFGIFVDRINTTKKTNEQIRKAK